MEGFNVVLGTLLGFVLGLVGSEVKTSRQRTRRRIEVAKLLKAEISTNKEKLVETSKSHKEAAGKDAWTLTSPYCHEVFRSCVADLPLLGDDALVAIQNLYAHLSHLEQAPRDALLALTQLYSVFRKGEKDAGDAERQERHLKETIHTWVIEREDEAVRAADNAMESLDKLVAQHKRWWQR